MSKKPAETPETEPETPVDRFEHEIEELERPLGRTGARQWMVALILAAALVAAFFLGSMLQKKTADAGRLVIPTIETVMPRSGTLSEKPSRFQWESISGANSYTLTIQEEGQEQNLIVKRTTTNSLTLAPEEVGLLAKGGRYTWRVTANSPRGTIAEGRSKFAL